MKLKLQRKFDQMTETKTKIREAFVDISSLILQHYRLVKSI